MNLKLTCFLIVVFTIYQVHASTAPDIIVHSNERKLEAPKADIYKWYLNDKILESENGQEIEVKESGLYSVIFTDSEGKETQIKAYISLEGGKIVRIHLIGDSTMQDYSIRSDYKTNYYPMAGWGEKLQVFLSSDSLYKIANIIEADSITVLNHAMGGRSTRSFWEEGRWQTVQDILQPGDYVFIQFGHNDAASCTNYPERCTSIFEYKDFLRKYVDSSRVKGAIPILITPMNRDYPWSNGNISNVHGEYPSAMKEVAFEKDVPLIDATQRSIDLFNEKGEELLLITISWFSTLGHILITELLQNILKAVRLMTELTSNRKVLMKWPELFSKVYKILFTLKLKKQMIHVELLKVPDGMKKNIQQI